MTNRYTVSLLTAVLISTGVWAQPNINNAPEQQQLINTISPPQRINTNNNSRQPAPQRQQAPQRSAPQAPVRMGGPNGPGGMRGAAPVRVTTAPPRQAGTTPQRQVAATPQRQAVTTPNRAATPQRQAGSTPNRGNTNPVANVTSNPPARNINVISSGPNGTGGISIPVVAINLPYRGGPNGVGGPNGGSFLINDNNVDNNVNPVLSNVIPVQAVVNNGNDVNVSRGNQDFVFELNNDININVDRGMRGNINVNFNVEAPQVQLQAPQINLPKVNKVELPEINLPKISLPEIKRGSGSSGGSGVKYKHKPSFKSNWKSFKRDVRYKWRKLSRKRAKMRYRVAECFFFGC